MSKLIGKKWKGYWLSEDSDGCPVLMFKDWMILSVNRAGRIQRFVAISNEPSLDLDKHGRVRLEKEDR